MDGRTDRQTDKGTDGVTFSLLELIDTGNDKQHYNQQMIRREPLRPSNSTHDLHNKSEQWIFQHT